MLAARTERALRLVVKKGPTVTIPKSKLERIAYQLSKAKAPDCWLQQYALLKLKPLPKLSS